VKNTKQILGLVAFLCFSQPVIAIASNRSNDFMPYIASDLASWFNSNPGNYPLKMQAVGLRTDTFRKPRETYDTLREIVICEDPKDPNNAIVSRLYQSHNKLGALVTNYNADFVYNLKKRTPVKNSYSLPLMVKIPIQAIMTAEARHLFGIDIVPAHCKATYFPRQKTLIVASEQEVTVYRVDYL
jgi:hypothetical protein